MTYPSFYFLFLLHGNKLCSQPGNWLVHKRPNEQLPCARCLTHRSRAFGNHRPRGIPMTEKNSKDSFHGLPRSQLRIQQFGRGCGLSLTGRAHQPPLVARDTLRGLHIQHWNTRTGSEYWSHAYVFVLLVKTAITIIKKYITKKHVRKFTSMSQDTS